VVRDDSVYTVAHTCMHMRVEQRNTAVRVCCVFSVCVSSLVVRYVSKLVNSVAPDTVDERALTFPKKGKSLNVWECNGNANLALGAARAAGCKIVNFHVEDMVDCVNRHSVRT